MTLSPTEEALKRAELEHIRGVLANNERELADRDRAITRAEREVRAAEEALNQTRLARKSKADDVARVATLVQRLERELADPA